MPSMADSSPTRSARPVRSSGSPPVRRILRTPSAANWRASAQDLVEGQALGGGQETVALAEGLARHAIRTAEIAAIHDRDAQVERAAVRAGPTAARGAPIATRLPAVSSVMAYQR